MKIYVDELPKNCKECPLWVCGGAQYNIPNLCEQPFCNKVRNELKELKNE